TMIVLFLGICGTTWQAIRATHQSKVALSRQLAAQASSAIGTELDLALLLSIEAERISPTSEASEVLLKALQSQPEIVSILNHNRRLAANTIAFTPDGCVLASGGENGKLVLWDTNKQQILIGPLTGHSGWINTVLYNPN